MMVDQPQSETLLTTDEMLIGLDEQPVGVGYATLVREGSGGTALTLVTRCEHPLLSPYYIMIAPAKGGAVSPLFEIMVGYPDQAAFAQIILRAPLVRLGRTWTRDDEVAARLINQLINVADEVVGYEEDAQVI